MVDRRLFPPLRSPPHRQLHRYDRLTTTNHHTNTTTNIRVVRQVRRRPPQSCTDDVHYHGCVCYYECSTHADAVCWKV